MSFRVTITLPDSAEDFIDKIARPNDISRAEVVRWMLPVFFWDATTGKPVPPGPSADQFPSYEQSARRLFS